MRMSENDHNSHLLEKHNAILEFTDEHGLDFNEREVYYESLDYGFSF